MTRDQVVARINELQAQLDSQKHDPLQSYSGSLAISAPLLRELSSLHEQLRKLDAKRPG
jgi:hypothetical protein